MDVLFVFADTETAGSAAAYLTSIGHTVEVEKQPAGAVGVTLRRVSAPRATGQLVNEMTRIAADLGGEYVAYAGP
jgi:hypothetical protein